MARAEWITGGLDSDAKAALGKELDRVLAKFSEDQRREFLEAADEAVGEYRVLHKPAADSFERNRQLLEGLAHAAYEFDAAARPLAHSLRLLEPDMRELLEREIQNLGGRPLGFPDPAEIEGTAKRALEQAAGAIALFEALRKKTDGRRAGGAVGALIEALARAYQKAFQKPPSYAKAGIFRQALLLVLDSACIDEPVGEKRLEGIMERMEARSRTSESIVNRLTSRLRQ